MGLSIKVVFFWDVDPTNVFLKFLLSLISLTLIFLIRMLCCSAVLASLSSLQVWLWLTSPYDCSSRLQLIRSRVFPAEYCRCICLWCQSFTVGQRCRRAPTDDKEDGEDCRREWRQSFFLHLRETKEGWTKTRGERKNIIPVFFFFIKKKINDLQPHQLSQMVQSQFGVTETALVPSSRLFDKTCDFSDTHREAASWRTANRGMRPWKPLLTLKPSSFFLVFNPLLKMELGERVCVCACACILRCSNACTRKHVRFFWFVFFIFCV